MVRPEGEIRDALLTFTTFVEAADRGELADDGCKCSLRRKVERARLVIPVLEWVLADRVTMPGQVT